MGGPRKLRICIICHFYQLGESLFSFQSQKKCSWWWAWGRVSLYQETVPSTCYSSSNGGKVRPASEADSPLSGTWLPLRQLGPHLCPGTVCVSTWNPRSSESCHAAAPSSWTGARHADARTGLGCFFKNSFCELIKLI